MRVGRQRVVLRSEARALATRERSGSSLPGTGQELATTNGAADAGRYKGLGAIYDMRRR